MRVAWGVAVFAAALLAVTAMAAVAGIRTGQGVEARDWLLALICAPLGARVAAYAPRNPSGWLLLTIGLLASATVVTSVGGAPLVAWIREWAWWPSFGLLILIALIFPDGRVHSRFWRAVAGATVAATVAGTIALANLAARVPGDFLTDPVPVTPGWDTVSLLGALAVLAAAALCTPVSLLVRLRRAPAGTRGTLIWAVANALLLLVGLLLDTLGIPLAWMAAALAVPVATSIGVVRYGLYDIGQLLHRTLSYGVFSGGVIVAYTAAVTVATELVPSDAPVAAAVIVVALLPLWRWLDRLVRRALFGLSAEPYRMSTLLGREIGQARTPDEVLRAAVETISEGLRSPYVAIRLGDREPPVADAGHRRDWPVTDVTLAYRGECIGVLMVQQRGPDEDWSRSERALLGHLADHLAPSAASVRLTHDLQAARERLVRAREDELRRLQHDLHDGVGPALSGARMLVELGKTTGTTDLERIEDSLSEAAAEVRRMVDGLRPPALENGLAGALSVAVCRHLGGSPEVSLDLAGDLDELPAAVEVAVFRLVDEGLTNVVRHACATTATVTVRRDADVLRVTVDDDGVGGATARPGGVGLDSMRQRCEELGGSFRIVARTPGTLLRAVIPLV